MSYVAALYLVPNQIRYQINTVPTPAVAWTRAYLYKGRGGDALIAVTPKAIKEQAVYPTPPPALGEPGFQVFSERVQKQTSKRTDSAARSGHRAHQHPSSTRWDDGLKKIVDSFQLSSKTDNQSPTLLRPRRPPQSQHRVPVVAPTQRPEIIFKEDRRRMI